MDGPANGGDARPEAIPVPDRRRPAYQALRADGRRMLTLHEVAWHLNTTVPIVRKLIAANVLRCVQYSARVTRVPEGSVVGILNR